MSEARATSIHDKLDSLQFSDVPISARYQRSDILAWLSAEYVCQRLTEDPAGTIQIMRQTFERFWRNPGYLSPRLVAYWDQLLNGPAEAIIAVLRRDDDRGAHMRQIMPSQGLFDESIRMPLFTAASRLFSERHR